MRIVPIGRGQSGALRVTYIFTGALWQLGVCCYTARDDYVRIGALTLETTGSLFLLAGGLFLLRCSLGNRLGQWMLRRPRLQTTSAQQEIAALLVQLDEASLDSETTAGRRAELRDSIRAEQARGSAEPSPELLRLAGGVVADLVQANELLRDRLTTAELKLRQQAQQVKSHASAAATDSLTRLPNRRALDEVLVRRVRDAQLENLRVTFVLIDVDHFKHLNDTRGHQTGDLVLQKLARLLAASIRTGDFVGRYGGEEFGIVLVDVSPQQAQRIVAQLLYQVAASRFRIRGQALSFTASAGGACLEFGETVADLIARADQALYAAKDGGRNVAYFHDGAGCQRVARPTPPSGSEPAEEYAAERESRTPQDADAPMGPELRMAAVCNELRSRAAELQAPANSEFDTSLWW